MRTVVAVGTRKGLWLAEQQAPGRAWHVTGPRFLMQEVPAVAWDSRDEGRLLAGVRSEQATLVVGTRDGCVYASSDDGERFEEVVRHLPDVLSVRAVRLP